MREHQSPTSDDSSPELPVDLNTFESQLAQFRPAPSTLDREQLMFEAGRAAAFAESDHLQSAAGQARMRRVLRLWQTAAMVMFTVSVGLSASLVTRTPKLIIVERDSPPASIDLSESKPISDVSPSQLILPPDTLPPVTLSQSVPQSASSKADRDLTGTSVTSPVTIAVGPLRARRLALDESLELADGVLRTSHSIEDPQNAARIEPPLTPRSLLGDQAGLTLERLMKEST